MFSKSKSSPLGVTVVSNRSQLDDLPSDLIMLVCSFLNSKQVLLLALVSPSWNEFVNNKRVLQSSIKQYCLTNNLESKSTHGQVFARMNASRLKLLMRNSIKAQSQYVQQKGLKALLAIKKEFDTSQQPVLLSPMPGSSFSQFVFNWVRGVNRKSADNELKRQLKDLDRTQMSVVTIETMLEDRKHMCLLR